LANSESDYHQLNPISTGTKAAPPTYYLSDSDSDAHISSSFRNSKSSLSCGKTELAYPSTPPNELHDLEECLNWWKEKCAYCIGQNVSKSAIGHKLESCPKDGWWKRDQGLGEWIVPDEYFTRAGCRRCALPVSLCRAWEQYTKTQWRRREDGKCRWDTVVYDTVVTLFNSSAERFYLNLYITIEEELDSEYESLDYDRVARWLGRPIRRRKRSRAAEISLVFIRWTNIVQRELASQETQ